MNSKRTRIDLLLASAWKVSVDEGRGSVAWLIVQSGTLRIGDAVICGKSYGYIRAMYDDKDLATGRGGTFSTCESYRFGLRTWCRRSLCCRA